MIGFEQSAEPFDTDYLGIRIDLMLWFNDSAQRLMDSLVMTGSFVKIRSISIEMRL